MENVIETGSSKPRVRFVADGESKEFNFFFSIFSPEDIDVYLDGKLLDTGYIVNRLQNLCGGYVTFDTAPKKDCIITISRNLSIKRTTDFSESKAFRSNMLNHEFDYQVACLEQLSDHMNRSISFPVHAVENINTAFPFPKAGKAIMWNQDADALINSNIDIETLDNCINEILQTKDNLVSALNEVEATRAEHATLEALIASKANAALDNINSSTDFIVDSYISEDKVFWYKKYQSGWIEQGGIGNTASHWNPITVNLCIPFINTTYTISAMGLNIKMNALSCDSRTKTNFQMKSVDVNNNVGCTYLWRACGF